MGTIDWAAGAGSLSAGGKRLEWAAFGGPPRGESPVIVMLHEGLGCVALWRDFPRRVNEATGLPVLAYSRAGYGRSDAADLPRSLDYMTHEAEAVLPDVLAGIEATRYLLLGHSDGATIAAEYAGRVEDFRVRGLILMAPHFFTEPMGLNEISRARDAFLSTDLAERMAKYHDNPVATFRGWNDAWLDPRFRSWNVSDVIDYIRVPSLVIQGRQDQYGTEAQVEEFTRRCYAPVEVAMLDGCRHSPQFDQPDAALAAIAAFVTRLERIEG
ncbi:hydrolase [Allgaiera indica]|uniref:Hydrolase n=1 Tax=Allgaiera indica TaxID=765699 RepID=A0AAN5A0E0_9RHOB|nr:alpha/beta hydrolase [Allgaiera indica]GHE03287.1 hydrolase [Allgaiera indica]SDX22827.1 Lysophospholipase, alpha-beta hydrolase superfamily [Allgaiera indica]